ncbi:hypothetical protein DOZ96_09155 [Campylobacter jejuni]|nr:hypothetical protein [Campylobacter jejuni]
MKRVLVFGVLQDRWKLINQRYIIPQITFADILQSPKTKQYYIYNQDYQDYQKFTPYGLDFKLYSKDFITKLDFKDKAYNVLYNTGV